MQPYKFQWQKGPAGLEPAFLAGTRQYGSRQVSSIPLLTSPPATTEDHILRSSIGYDVKNHRVRTSSNVTNPYDDFVPPEDLSFRRNKNRSRSGRFSKYSPTTSIKRGKAEKLLKEHGSPPGIRVTAGGRIVPDGLSPISSPQFDVDAGFRNGQTNRLNNPIGYGAIMPTLAKPLNGYVVDLGYGTLYQVVDNELRPVDHHNGVLQLHMPAPNLPVHPGMLPMGPFTGIQATLPFLPPPAASTGFRTDGLPVATEFGIQSRHLPTEREVRVMEQAHARLEQDLKDLDRHEVLQRSLLNQTNRADIVRTRISLVNRIDESRRAVENAKKALEDDAKLVYHRVPKYSTMLPATFPVEHANVELDMHSARSSQFLEPRTVDYMMPPVPHLNAFGNEFQPGVPEFVPQRYGFLPKSDSEIQSALKERPGNVAFGLKIDSESHTGSIETIKGFDATQTSGCMSLDGSFQLPRRSHAIEIKKPVNEPAKNKAHNHLESSTHNRSDTTTSCSGNDNVQGEMLTFIPSPSLVAQMDNLVQSPRQRSNPLDGYNLETQQSSESSATTADFFPQDAYQHSFRKRNIEDRDAHANLAAWMPKDGEPDNFCTQATPPRPPNKFVFNDDSPSDGYESNSLRITRNRPDTSPVASRNRPALTMSAEVSPHKSGQPVWDSGPDSFQSDEIDVRAATLPATSPRKSVAYWEGYRTGSQKDVLEDNKNEDYRIGYRDGLIQSTVVPDSARLFSCDARSQMSSHSLAHTQNSWAQGGNRIPSVTKATSFPSFGAPGVSFPSVPVPPSNSLATTPTKYGSAKKDKSPMTELSLDSPAARADFMSQPNVNINHVHDRSVHAHTSRSPPTNTEPECPSPLANRSSSRRLGNTSPNKTNPSFATRIQSRRGTFDQQRYQKSSTSVAQTNDHARAQFPPPYDGSGEDEKQYAGTLEHLPMTSSSYAKDKGKAKQPPSPVKARASAAVATMKQAAGIGSKREDGRKEEHSFSRKGSKKQKEADPATMSSPEKRKWRENWAKNFRQLKREEEDEIEKYKRENPVP